MHRTSPRILAIVLAALVGSTSARAAAPANLVATASNDSTVVLTWDPYEGATSYRIYRKVGGWSLRDEITAAIWWESGLGEATFYEYKVAAMCGGDPCRGPTFASVTTLLKAPTAVTAQVDNANQTEPVSVVLAWTDNTTLESSYEVDRRFGWESGWTTIHSSPGPNVTSFTDTPATGALDWAKADYRIRAVSATNSSANTLRTAKSTWGDTSQDWCSTVAVRPDQSGWSPGCAEPYFTKQELADDVSLVLMGTGFLTTANDAGVPDWGAGCGSTQWGLDDSHQSYGDFIAEVRALEAPGDEPTRFADFARFDLVTPRLLAYATFDASWLVDTTTPFADVISFVETDVSPDCEDADPNPPVIPSCKWHDIAPLIEPDDPSDPWWGKRLRDLIDAHEQVAGAWESKVFYLPAFYDPQHPNPVAAVARQDDADYRAFRVSEAAASVAVADWDFVNLNHKLGQYKSPNEEWMGGAGREDMTLVNNSGSAWTAQPDGYGYEQYVLGWGALADELATSGVPKVMFGEPRMWPSTTNGTIDVQGSVESYYDDVATITNEAATIRAALYTAELVVMERREAGYPSVTDDAFREVVGDLRAHGVEVVVVHIVDSGNNHAACDQ